MSGTDTAPFPPLNYVNIYLSHGYSYTCQRYWDTLWAARMVGAGQAPVYPFSELPANLITEFIQEAVPLGLRSIRLTGLSNRWDPLLYSEIHLLLEHIKAFRTEVHLETSGAGLEPPIARRLAHIPHCKVHIALAGVTPFFHDAFFLQQGAFDAATRAVRMLADQGVAVELLFPVIRRNANQVQAVIQLAERLGAQSLLFIAVSPLNNMDQRSPMTVQIDEKFKSLSVEELIALGRKVERQYQPQTRVNLLFDQPPAFRGLHPSARLDGQNTCGISNSISLLPSGAYALCGMAFFGDELSEEPGQSGLNLGRAGYDVLKHIWCNHPVLAALREGRPERLAGVCERCAVKSACLGRCPIENHIRTGSFWGPYWFCEAAERAGLFPAGRLIENH